MNSLKDGVYYVVMKVEAPNEEGAQPGTGTAGSKGGWRPALVRGEAFMANTFQRVLLGYEKTSAGNP